MAWVTKQTAIRNRSGYFYNGREIALTKRQGSVKKKPRHKGSWYPEEMKLEAATVWAVTKSYSKTRELTGIYESVIKNWAKEPWWDSVVREVVREKNEELDGALSKAIHKAVDLISERLDNGDYHYNYRTNESVRVPLRAKDASGVLDVLFTKRQLLRGEATSRTETVTEETRLKTLKANFEALARSKGINPEKPVIEGELIHAEKDGTGTEEGGQEEGSDRAES